MTTYTLKITYRDGSGHTYTNVAREDIGGLTARQFNMQYDRPETVEITTTRTAGGAQ